MNKIYFSLPGFWHHFKLNMNLLHLFDAERTKFYDNAVIDNFYDSFPCIWNGGRITLGYTSMENITSTAEAYNSRGVSIRHTFTNCLLTEDDLKDRLCNTICRITEHTGTQNGITYNMEMLGDYVAEHYPGFYQVVSTTRRIADIDKVNELSESKLVVLDYTLNNDFDELSKLKHPDNVEILVCEACVSSCAFRTEHNTLTSQQQLYEAPSDADFPQCPRTRTRSGYYYDVIPNRTHHISIEDINAKYLPLGINKVKISGRLENPINVIEHYVNYLVKPEYRDDIRNKLLMDYFG